MDEQGLMPGAGQGQPYTHGAEGLQGTRAVRWEGAPCHTG